jgi:hypothetical protein
MPEAKDNTYGRHSLGATFSSSYINMRGESTYSNIQSSMKAEYSDLVLKNN